MAHMHDMRLHVWVVLMLLQVHSRQRRELYEFIGSLFIRSKAGKPSCLALSAATDWRLLFGNFSEIVLRAALTKLSFLTRRSWLVNTRPVSVPLPSEYDKAGFYKTYLHLGCDKREEKCGIFYASEILNAGKNKLLETAPNGSKKAANSRVSHW